MSKVFFMVNKIKDFCFADLIEKYLSNCSVTVGETLPVHTEEYNLIVLWSYRKILANVAEKKNIILFHSSDLPEGKGWAPIYHSIRSGKDDYVISGIFADKEVDSGDIIVKAKFKIKDNYTADIIRRWDAEISIMLVREILDRFRNKIIKGIKQSGAETYYRRRKPEDNEVSLNSTIEDVLNHLRACENDHPAFVMYRDIKYKIFLEPLNSPTHFPEDLKITFFDDQQK